MSGESVQQYALSLGAWQALSAAVVGTGLTVLVSGVTIGTDSLGAALLGIGGPTALGVLAVNAVGIYPSDGTLDMNEAYRGLVCGAAGVGFLMLAGQLPVSLDVQLAGTVGLIGVSAVAGDFLGNYLKGSK